MKTSKVLSSVVVLAFFALTSFAGNNQSNNNNVNATEQEVPKKAIEADQLPEAVKEALKISIAEGWTVSEVFLVEKPEKTVYMVNLKKGEETKSLKFAPNGEIINKEKKE
jgi:hypothetical protein